MCEIGLADKIYDILLENFSYVYCYNCENNLNEDNCEDCHRKYMNWKISHSLAREISEKIEKLVSESVNIYGK